MLITNTKKAKMEISNMTQS